MFETIHKTWLCYGLYIVSAHPLGFYNVKHHFHACLSLEDCGPGGPHLVMGEPPTLGMEIHVKLKATSAVPLWLLFPSMGSRWLPAYSFERMTLLSCSWSSHAEGITTLDVWLDFMDFKCSFPTFRFCVSMSLLPVEK